MMPATPHVRPYRPADYKPVVDLLADSDPWKRLGYTAAHWERLFEPFPVGRDGYVIEVDGRVAGLALVRRQFLFGDYLELLAIAPGRQGQGLGNRLLGHVEQIVFTRAKNLFACVSDFNTGARRFYQRHGYREIGPMPDLLMPGSSEILLRKTIGSARSG
ncbi:N-acetyltransferase family protein [Candidatus Nitrospira bockiana]